MSDAAVQSPFPAGSIRLGIAIVAVFTGVFSLWFLAAPLNSAVIAPGVVHVESYRKSIQHLEGGIIDEILVKDGEIVRRGDVLVKLRDVGARATVDRLRTQVFEATANVARLTAEREGKMEITFPDVLAKASPSDKVAQSAMTGQRIIFDSRKTFLNETLSVLDKRIEQSDAEIVGLKGQLASITKRLGIFSEELDSLTDLYDKKLVSKKRYLEVKRERLELHGKKSEIDSLIAKTKQEVLEFRQKRTELLAENLAKVNEELEKQRAHAFKFTQRLIAAEDVLERAKIRSPIDGTVVNSQIHTRDGVVAAGQTLMEIVPVSDDLIVEGRVRPEDIEEVHQGQSAHIVLTTFSRRSARPVIGTLQSVSADRITDKLTGKSFYQVRASIDKNSLANQEFPLLAGMGADIFIQTGERTPFEYMFAPVLRTFSRGMRER